MTSSPCPPVGPESKACGRRCSSTRKTCGGYSAHLMSRQRPPWSSDEANPLRVRFSGVPVVSRHAAEARGTEPFILVSATERVCHAPLRASLLPTRFEPRPLRIRADAADSRFSRRARGQRRAPRSARALAAERVARAGSAAAERSAGPGVPTADCSASERDGACARRARRTERCTRRTERRTTRCAVIGCTSTCCAPARCGSTRRGADRGVTRCPRTGCK